MVYPDLTDFLNRLHNQLPILWKFVTGFVYLLGMGIAFKAVMQFKGYADMRLMASSTPEFKKAVVSLFVAVALLYAPRLASLSLNTAFGITSPADYHPGGETDENFKLMVKTCGEIVEWVGFIAFVRGWLLLGQIGSQGAQPGMFGKALSYIIAGLFAINIFGTWDIIKATFGFS